MMMMMMMVAVAVVVKMMTTMTIVMRARLNIRAKPWRRTMAFMMLTMITIIKDDDEDDGEIVVDCPEDGLLPRRPLGGGGTMTNDATPPPTQDLRASRRLRARLCENIKPLLGTAGLGLAACASCMAAHTLGHSGRALVFLPHTGLVWPGPRWWERGDKQGRERRDEERWWRDSTANPML